MSIREVPVVRPIDPLHWKLDRLAASAHYAVRQSVPGPAARLAPPTSEPKPQSLHYSGLRTCWRDPVLATNG